MKFLLSLLFTTLLLPDGVFANPVKGGVFANGGVESSSSSSSSSSEDIGFNGCNCRRSVPGVCPDPTDPPMPPGSSGKGKGGKGKGGSSGRGDTCVGGKGSLPNPDPNVNANPSNPCSDDRLYCCIGRGKGGNFCSVQPCEFIGEEPCCIEKVEEFCPPPNRCCEIKGTSEGRMCEFSNECDTLDPRGFFVECGEGGYGVDPDTAPAESFCSPVYPYCCELDIPASNGFPRDVFQECSLIPCAEIPSEVPGSIIKSCGAHDPICYRKDLGVGFCCQFPGFSSSRHCDGIPCENFPGEVPCNISPEGVELPVPNYTDDGDCDDFGLCNGHKPNCCFTAEGSAFCREEPCAHLGETPCFDDEIEEGGGGGGPPMTKKEKLEKIRNASKHRGRKSPNKKAFKLMHP